MTVRSIAQVVAGVVAGAVLVGAPTVAFASENDDSARPSSGMTEMMRGQGSPSQMMGSMSEMMDDPAMREQMRSMMSEMPSDGMSGQGMSGMGPMADMSWGSMTGRPSAQ